MVELIVDEEMAATLREIAARENRPVLAVLHSMVEQYSTSLHSSNWALEMAQLAETDTDIIWREDTPDLSERSREILEAEFEDYLLRNMRDDERHPR